MNRHARIRVGSLPHWLLGGVVNVQSLSIVTFWFLVASSFGAESSNPSSESSAAPTVENKRENWGYHDPDWTLDVPNWSPVDRGEHPRLVFRKSDLPALKRRAQTPEGQVILQRLKALLEGKFTLWHPTGNGLLYQLTGDKQYADKARDQVSDIIDKRKHDAKDARYGFSDPGSGGPMRAGPAISAVGLAYDLNYDGWDEDFRRKVAVAIQDNPFTASISANGPIMPSCNHYGAAVGGTGIGLLAIRGDVGTDSPRIERDLARILKQARDEISIGYGDRGYYFEGHQCGRISSNTGLIPFIQACRVAAGKDLVGKKDNARWLAAKWIYEFAANPGGKYTDAQRGMYCRDFPRGGMWSEQNDFCMGFGICPAEYLPALKWVYNHQVEPGTVKTFDVLDYPHQAIYALANWPLDVAEKSPSDQPDLFPHVLHDTAAGYVVFRNGWSDSGADICVSALLGTHPTHQNGRGMASGGSVYVYGKGLGWTGDHARYRFPGMFYESYPIYSKFAADGSGVISAVTYSERLNKFSLNVEECSTHPTSLMVDFTKKSGADLVVAMVGPMVGYEVQYWMDIKPTRINDVIGEDGYATKTTQVMLSGKTAYVMTLQKGNPPKVIQEVDQVTVGGLKLVFDGQKILMSP